MRARVANRYYISPEHELLGFHDGCHVLRDPSGEVHFVISQPEEWVEIQCERCGRFGQDVWHGGCFDSGSDAGCAEAAELERRAGPDTRWVY